MAIISRQQLSTEEQEILHAVLKDKSLSGTRLFLFHIFLTLFLSSLPVRHIPLGMQPEFTEKVIEYAIALGVLLFIIGYSQEKKFKRDIAQGIKTVLQTTVQRKMRFYANNTFTITLKKVGDNNAMNGLFFIDETDYHVLHEGEVLLIEYSEETNVLFALRRQDGEKVRIIKAPKEFLT